jgi:hypothetical protein
MTRVETELFSALVLIYMNECVYWLGPNDLAYTRSSAISWKTHRNDVQSFTLLGKMPILVDPFLLLPGFIKCPVSTLALNPSIDRTLRRVSKQAMRIWFLEVQCQVQGILLLLFLPWILWNGRLVQLWQNLLFAIFLTHLSIVISSCLVLRKNQLSISTALQLLPNPIGAIRFPETLAQLLFDRLSNQKQ